MLRFLWVFMALAILLSSCMATKTMIGIEEPDLAEIKLGSQRSHAEKLLGRRLWYVGIADGLAYDIYQYEAEQGADPILGGIFLGMDYITLGLFESGFYDTRNYGRVKQVAVAYDDQDRVVFVSKPWAIETIGPCRRQRKLLPTDSGVPVTAHPGPLNGLALSTTSNAKLEVNTSWLDGKIVASVDDHELGDSAVELSSGHHEVKANYDDGRTITATVEFLPGRLYRLKRKHYFKSSNFYWIEDVNSEETLYCVPPPKFSLGD